MLVIDIPGTIDYVGSEKIPIIEISEYLTIDDTKDTYSLYAIVVHERYYVESGHYYSYGKKNGTWYKLNDENFTTTVTSIVRCFDRKHSPHMLFYTKDKKQSVQVLPAKRSKLQQPRGNLKSSEACVIKDSDNRKRKVATTMTATTAKAGTAAMANAQDNENNADGSIGKDNGQHDGDGNGDGNGNDNDDTEDIRDVNGHGNSGDDDDNDGSSADDKNVYRINIKIGRSRGGPSSR